MLGLGVLVEDFALAGDRGLLAVSVAVAFDAEPHGGEGNGDGAVAAECGGGEAAELAIGERSFLGLLGACEDSREGLALGAGEDLRGRLLVFVGFVGFVGFVRSPDHQW